MVPELLDYLGVGVPSALLPQLLIALGHSDEGPGPQRSVSSIDHLLVEVDCLFQVPRYALHAEGLLKEVLGLLLGHDPLGNGEEGQDEEDEGLESWARLVLGFHDATSG